MRVERRIPFGFTGDWGKVYKKHDFPETVTIDSVSTFVQERDTYVAIDSDVQFKIENPRMEKIKQVIKGAQSNAKTCVVTTTDSYFDNDTKQYECVARPLDVIEVFGELWTVLDVLSEVIYAPNALKYFHIGLESRNRGEA